MRILLAEDERELSNALAAILKHNHYSVDQVFDGLQALDYLDTQLYDGVVLDIMMPGADGLTVLRSIRQKGNVVPVILLTAKSEVDDKVEGLDCGANDYLTKPFASRELLARIRAMTRQGSIPGGNGGDVLVLGNVELERSAFLLSTPKGSIRLSNKEFQMMEMLLMNPRQLLSRDKFMEKIWGYDSEAEVNVVWVNISNLRKKLAELEADIQIKASRNQGYSLEEDGRKTGSCTKAR